MSFLDRLMASTVRWAPKALVWRIARNYVAGPTMDDAVSIARQLNGEGCRVTFDVLGEFIRNVAQGVETAAAYERLLDRIHAEKLDANVSIKLTAFGLLLDEDAACANARRVVERAAARRNFVRIDMEDSACTEATLGIYRRLRESGLPNVGVALQSYMRRTVPDIRALADLPDPNYRLCKGIYIEPEEIAFQDREEVRQNYLAALEAMFETGSYVGIATHDEVLVDAAQRMIRERGLGRDRYEFQMLLGVQAPLRRRLVADAHPLRVYVPFGRDWYGYCVRRLKENPAMARHVFMALFRKR